MRNGWIKEVRKGYKNKSDGKTAIGRNFKIDNVSQSKSNLKRKWEIEKITWKIEWVKESIESGEEKWLSER